ncbi:MAG TPA: hypothetical protein VE981_10850 [Planctomycetota bacterium]|nr:hypothetical protein [Planctomycetota bacterium]
MVVAGHVRSISAPTMSANFTVMFFGASGTMDRWFVLSRIEQKELLGYLFEFLSITPKELVWRFWNKSPLLDTTREGGELGESRFASWADWWAVRDSNP